MEGLSSWWSYVMANTDSIVEESITHLQVVGISVGLATIIAVTLAVLIYRNPLARTAVLSIASIMLTVPSLALFAVFVPIVGIGNAPAVIALVIYAQLPILRNTVTGLTGVSPAVVESAKGMGMTSMQQLTKIRLPLALPLILAGVRVSTLLTVSIAAITVLVGGSGLGSFIQRGITSQGFEFANNAVYTGTVFIILIGLLLDALLRLLQRLVTPTGLAS